MGLRSLERRLRPEIREVVVRRVVEDYLERSYEAEKLLNPVTELRERIQGEGFHPYGLFEAVRELQRLRVRQRPKRAHLNLATGEWLPPKSDPAETPPEPPEYPDPDELVERILAPAPKKVSPHEKRLHRIYSRQVPQ